MIMIEDQFLIFHQQSWHATYPTLPIWITEFGYEVRSVIYCIRGTVIGIFVRISTAVVPLL